MENQNQKLSNRFEKSQLIPLGIIVFFVALIYYAYRSMFWMGDRYELDFGTNGLGAIGFLGLVVFWFFLLAFNIIALVIIAKQPNSSSKRSKLIIAILSVVIVLLPAIHIVIYSYYF